ncbi:O-acetylhomoserine aminocarboxypropyltransferase/cysteine synthase family protein [Desulfovibrio legallii]|uniref:O-acetylhomoserine aminocarboxypropyltransferase/cysteine synthase n=2 Tax=Desulfovibrio TaxID=872 RepID=A0A6H3FE67_9BACT|nr:O-acetylhomoserine aminocarboxypropyltransferase/cysteine synthase family protein [Desulfovibrio legallii]TBH81495.1 O-acetylhomoserine aminocarboxypropyltransferase/cysteine synthase [Desulfovibrio legallii]CAI3234277.1 O-acetylhomoserine sulfhydrylase (EC @ O-succinylhomoserine sulfhydrylase (EC [Desulfovibrio diazotrophicus]
MKTESLCLHAGYEPGNGEPRVLPIAQSTTFRYATTAEVAKLFDLAEAGFFYSRLGNPTVDAVERKIAALEGGVGALCTSSGQAASMLSVLNVARSGDHVVSASSIYGGTFNLFAVTLKRMGIEVTFVDQNATDAELEKAFRPETRAVFGETLSNPSMDVLDLERFAKLAHRHRLPFIVDNTFATPVLCRPFEFGADIVVHSTTKYMDGHALQVGGVIVDSGNFDWASGKFPEFTEPDPSYHGLIYTKAFGQAAYIVKARAQLMRDMGCCQTPQGAFYINLGLETLPLRMERHCRNAEAVAQWLCGQPAVDAVNYPRLPGHPHKALADKYLPKGCSGVIAFTLKGGREAGARFIDSLKMVSLEVHVADIRTCVLHPASSTHRQLTDQQLADAGISPGMVRLSVGTEHLDDILEDLGQALAQV